MRATGLLRGMTDYLCEEIPLIRNEPSIIKAVNIAMVELYSEVITLKLASKEYDANAIFNLMSFSSVPFSISSYVRDDDEYVENVIIPFLEETGSFFGDVIDNFADYITTAIEEWPLHRKTIRAVCRSFVDVEIGDDESAWMDIKFRRVYIGEERPAWEIFDV